MNVIMLTVFLGLMLVSFFICFFLHQHAGSRHAAGERDALLPLQEEKNSTAISHKAKVHPINDPL